MSSEAGATSYQGQVEGVGSLESNGVRIVADGEQQVVDDPSRRTGPIAGHSNSNNPRRSKVFKRKAHTDGTATKFWRCTLCATPTSWRDPPNTSNFWNHLESHHTTEHRALKEREARDAGSTDAPRSAEFSKEQKKKATDALVKWIDADSHPFSLVEQDRFKAFCEILQPDYTVPCRKTIRDRIEAIWKSEKSAATATILADLQRCCRRAAVTSDLWTSYARRGYMVTTIHYINNDWHLRSTIIGFVRVVYPHSGDRLGVKLLEGMDDMSPEIAPYIWSVTADNASNNDGMVDAFVHSRNQSLPREVPTRSEPFGRENHVSYLRCLPHIIQLAVRHGTTKCESMNTTLGGLREVVKKIAESPKFFEKYASVCQSLNPPVAATKFKLDVDPRWNSTFDMVGHLLKSKPQLDDQLHRIQAGHTGFTDLSVDAALALRVDDESWESAKLFFTFLQPFKDATVLLSGATYTTMGCVVSTYKALAFHTDKHVTMAKVRLSGFENARRRQMNLPSLAQHDPQSESASVGDRSVNQSIAVEAVPPDPAETRMKRALQRFEGVQSKLTEYTFVSETPTAQIAAELDPRFKSQGPPDRARLLADIFNRAYRDRFVSQLRSRYGVDNEASMTSPAGKTSSLMEAMLESSRTHKRSTTFRSIEEEVNGWVSSEGLDARVRSSEILHWWRTNEIRFPRLAMMAKDYLAIPATSVPSESAFSRAGINVDKKRARLGDTAVRQLSELQSFLEFNPFVIEPFLM